MSKPLHLISLGAGVQSSTMALMAAAGEITPMPYAAIFADTKAEPASVYKWLDWLEKQLPFPVIRSSRGDLMAESLDVIISKNGKAYTDCGIPAFVKNPDGTHGIMRRQCTENFKIEVLRREAKRLMKETKSDRVTQWIGISLDEVHRMKPSRQAWMTNIWPLVDHRKRRHDCLLWMDSRGYPKPPRSACVFCPYHSDNEWRRLRDEEPEAFERAVLYERDFHESYSKTRLIGKPFLHRSLVPLDQVDFSTDEDNGQQVMFGNECEGMCGV